MTRPTYEIRADFDRESIVVYQAYRQQIGEPAIKQQRFVPPFSFQRMTWIKPSFLWMMERSNWGQKSGQEYVLAIRIKRAGWERALKEAVLTHPEKSVYGNAHNWKTLFEAARVHVQWDPERSIRGKKLPYSSIQVGISRYLIEDYVNDWILSIEDCRPLVSKLHALCKQGDYDKAKKQLPVERSYPVPADIAHRLGMT